MALKGNDELKKTVNHFFKKLGLKISPCKVVENYYGFEGGLAEKLVYELPPILKK